MKESKVRTNEARKDLKLVMLPKKQNRDRNKENKYFICHQEITVPSWVASQSNNYGESQQRNCQPNCETDDKAYTDKKPIMN